MRARFQRSLRAAAGRAMSWLVARFEDLAVKLVRFAVAGRGGEGSAERAPSRRRSGRGRREGRPAPTSTPAAPAHADERTTRRIAEVQCGGLSSAESAARWARGDNPGGTHRRAVRRDEGEERPRPEQDEPPERKERGPGRERCIPVTRRGA